MTLARLLAASTFILLTGSLPPLASSGPVATTRRAATVIHASLGVHSTWFRHTERYTIVNGPGTPGEVESDTTSSLGVGGQLELALTRDRTRMVTLAASLTIGR